MTTKESHTAPIALSVSHGASMDQLEGGVHDLKNFMGALLGNLALARRAGYQGPEAIKRLEAAEKAAQQAKKLADTLLRKDVASEPQSTVIPFDQFLEEVASFTLSADGMQYSIRAPHEPLQVALTHSQLVRTLQNLLLNAQDALKGKGEVILKAEVKDRQFGDALHPFLQLTLTDNGPGMTEDVCNKIFQRGFSTKAHGHGIGLAQLKEWLEAVGGEISCESKLGEGTVFTVWIPIGAPLVQQDTKEGLRRILIVDDDEQLGEVAEAMLEALGYTTERVTSSAQAIRRYRQARETGMPFDSVILDLSLDNNEEGQAVLDTLKLYDPDIHAILSTGHTYSPQAQAYRDHGFAGYLPKPYDMEELGKILQEKV